MAPQCASPISEDSATPVISSKNPRGLKPKSSVPKFNVRSIFDPLIRPRKATIDSLDEATLAAIINQLEYDESELKFLDWLNGEINRIEEFYKEKEAEANERFDRLSEQLQVLRELRDHQLRESHSFPLSPTDPSSTGHVSKSNWVHRPLSRLLVSFDGFSSAMPSADHSRRAKQPELMAHPISAASGYVEYRIARRRLKQALLEFYRSMELLKGYRLMNRTGLTKILKKFDKTSGRHISPEYSEKLKPLHFYKSINLDSIMNRTEVRILFKES